MMKQLECVLGVDMGTGGARVGIFDLKGNPIVFCEESYPLYTPASGLAEQDPNEWWDAICKASKAAIAESGIDPAYIRGMSVDTTCCTVLLSKDDMVPLRPAIMWMDIRAAKQAKRMYETGHDALKYNGYGMVSAECLPAKALWLKENEPEVYHTATRFYECTDWLIHRLTGEYTASINCASCRWYYNAEEGGYPVDFYNTIGLEDLVEKLPSRVMAMGDLVGGLTPEAAEAMGLVPGIPVGEGGADAFVGVIGLNAVQPGKLTLITGSSHLHIAQFKEAIHSKGIWGSYPDAIVKGLQMVEGGQTSTGSIVNWVKEQLCGNYKAQAAEEGVSVYDILNREAEKLPIGSDGIIALDFFQGNRTPYVDADIRGMFYGLSLGHTPAHMYRAIIESICYGTEVIMDSFKEAGFVPEGIVISGGAVKSPFWLQTHADVSNVPIIVPKVTEGPCLGSAILGAVAGGIYPDIQTAAESMTTVDYIVEPSQERHDAYTFYYEKYKEFYPLAKDWMHAVTTH
ncbi:ribulokinase [Eubacterium aggregans]|uniref:Ribulokinase n=2 Tax=Eubacterium aggregans TaxID=81409 RepID=A0A1H4DP93_9FIRM|nr:FGGY-family carbohydrate kinase [Eubacterium aggregans]SEA74336.1 ribulokinase [Eubacterium aggregans]